MTTKLTQLLFVTGTISCIQGAEFPHGDHAMIQKKDYDAVIVDGDHQYDNLNMPGTNDVQVNFNSIASSKRPGDPAFQPKIYYQPVIGAPYKACIYFTIRTNGNISTNNQINASQQQVDGLYTNIYFPLDGKQPTAKEAAAWSCANVKNEDVTKWYMKMFGLLEIQAPKQLFSFIHKKIQAGFNKEGAPEALITISSNMGQTESEKFKKAFEQLAKSSVGRVLLYRILIEIRRMQSNVGKLEHDINVDPNTLSTRNKVRSVCIIHNNAYSGFQFLNEGEINFDSSVETDDTPVLTTLYNLIDNRHEIKNVVVKDTLDTYLFHEMLHWYHLLRSPVRVLDSQSKSYKYALRCYYGVADEAENLWKDEAENGKDIRIDDEEIRTILGVPDHSNPKYFALLPKEIFLLQADFNNTKIAQKVDQYVPSSERFLNGDDLSENAYRIEKGSDIRFCHNYCDDFSIQFCSEYPKRIKLAYEVASDCYFQLSGQTLLELVN